MKLSVIIVNYNVRYFLEQCLYSVQKASTGLDVEVFVVDNNSVDQSVKILREKFPQVNLIENKENKGFSVANNQAIRQAKGEYILLLNPDTVVEDTTFQKVITFMDEHPEAGGLGVKMIDGNGDFLPESKRGLPTPIVALYKILGLSKLFPKSKTFGKYHLGYLDENKTAPVDILAGAFMLLRKKTLDIIGLLDESFFMYGEDIDISYRITKAGFVNYYFPQTRIIHYKGESTKKTSVNYVITFYNAMVIFAKKHFSRKNARLFSTIINLAIYLRAFLAIISRFLYSILLPLMDAAIIYGGIYLFKLYWEKNITYSYGGHYPAEYMTIVTPVYILTWLFSVLLSGGYDRPFKVFKVFQGIFIGTVTILVFYALLSESYRFSRALLILGAAWALVSMIISRSLLHLLKYKDYRFENNKNRRFAIVGGKQEAERVADLLRKTVINPGFIGLVRITENGDKTNGFIGSLSQIKDIITIYQIDELIFCAKDIPAKDIIDHMAKLQDSQVDYKIAPPESMSIIGSKSINTSGDLYIININSISKTNNRRNKRFIDILISLILLFTFPVFIFVQAHPFGFIVNIFKVLLGFKTWIGYAEFPDANLEHLPKIRKGVLNPTDLLKEKIEDQATIERLNLLYARDFKISNDIYTLFKGFTQLGRAST